MTWTLSLVVKAPLVLLAASAAAWTLRRSSASVRHGLWCLTLLSLVALPILSASLPRAPLPLLPSAGAELVFVPPGMEAAVERSSAEAVAAPAPVEGWQDWAFLLWLSGVGLGLVQLALGSVLAVVAVGRARPLVDRRWHRQLALAAARLGVRRRVDLRVSDAVSVPIVWGYRSPTILLPPRALDWPEERMQTGLRHELAHVARFDCLTQTLAYVVRALYWPHPLVWWVVASLRCEAEKACDDRVLGAGDTAPDYARHLLEAARGLTRPTRPFLTAAAGAELTRLADRVKALLDESRDRRTPTRRAVLQVAGASLLALSALATAEPVAMGAGSPGLQDSAGETLAGWIVHEPVGCLVAGRFAEIDARIEPEPAEARLYFTSGRSADGKEYWVEMTRDGERYVGLLPKPLAKGASPVRYRIEARRSDGRAVGTDRYHVVVASEESRCPPVTRVAPHAPSVEQVTVQTTIDSPPAAAPADAALANWIVHEAVGCLVEGRYAEIDAIVEPPSDVAEVRLYFSSALAKGNVDYWTGMPRLGNRFRGRLPKPKVTASPIHYRIEARRTDGRLATTGLYTGVVVLDESGCSAAARVAPRAASTEPVRIY